MGCPSPWPRAHAPDASTSRQGRSGSSATSGSEAHMAPACSTRGKRQKLCDTPSRPVIPGLVFFAALAGVALVTSLPLVAYEVVTGTVTWPTPRGWLIVLYVGLFPSFVAQVLFMRGV